MSDDEYLEEEDRTFVINDNNDIPYLESPSKKNKNLDLNFAKLNNNSNNKYNNNDDNYDQHDNDNRIQEREILVVFELPDGSLGESYVRLLFFFYQFNN